MTPAVSPTRTLRASGVTDRGRIRPINEDCFGIDSPLQLCVVADGMGGHNAGEVASRMAVDAVLGYVTANAVTCVWPFGYDDTVSSRANLLRTAVLVANSQVFDAAAASPEYGGMGTTIVVVLVEGDLMTVAHVGDSRLYTLLDGAVEQLTSDDSWAAAMLAREPSIDPAVLRTHPMRNALTSVVGSRALVDVHVAERTLSADELLVLTTDGVHGVLSGDALGMAGRETPEPAALATRLVRSAIEQGSRDNCTAVVARYERD